MKIAHHMNTWQNLKSLISKFLNLLFLSYCKQFTKPSRHIPKIISNFYPESFSPMTISFFSPNCPCTKVNAPPRDNKKLSPHNFCMQGLDKYIQVTHLVTVQHLPKSNPTITRNQPHILPKPPHFHPNPPFSCVRDFQML